MFEKRHVYMLLVRTAFWEVIWQGIESVQMGTCFNPAISGVWLGMHAISLISICIAACMIIAKHWGNEIFDLRRLLKLICLFIWGNVRSHWKSCYRMLNDMGKYSLLNIKGKKQFAKIMYCNVIKIMWNVCQWKNPSTYWCLYTDVITDWCTNLNM